MKRYTELDSLRGIAALCVIFSHFVFVLQYVPNWISMINASPLRFLKGGHEAVIFFFVLSGFVLTLPFLRENSIKYSRYLISRFFRIYIPYISVLLFSLLLYYFTRSSSINVAHWWNSELTIGEIVRQALLVTEFNDSAINPVVWSLTQEMRISIIFPLIVYIVLKSKWYISIGLGVALSIIALILNHYIPSDFLNPISTNYFFTLHYIGMFIVGSNLAVNRDLLIKKVQTLSKGLRFTLFILGVIFYSYGGGLDKILNKVFPAIDNFPWMNMVSDWSISFGVGIIIISSLSSVKGSNFLRMKPLTFLGKISYSLYLVHAVLLLGLIHLLSNYLLLWQIELTVFLIVVPVAYVCYLLIEKPSMKLGKRLFKKFDEKNQPRYSVSSMEMKN